VHQTYLQSKAREFTEEERKMNNQLIKKLEESTRESNVSNLAVYKTEMGSRTSSQPELQPNPLTQKMATIEPLLNTN
jgi:hypothetical protein